MSGHKVLLDGLLDQRHVTCHALAPCAARGMMGMLSDRSMQARGILPGMADQANRVAFGFQVRLDVVAMDVMAIEAT